MDGHRDTYASGPPAAGRGSPPDRMGPVLVFLSAVVAVALAVWLVVLLTGDDGTGAAADTLSTEAPATSALATTTPTTAAPVTTAAPATTAPPPTMPPVYEQTIPANGAGWAANGSGCVPGGDTLPDGVWFGFITEVTTSSPTSFTLDFDMGCLYTGAAAAAEAEHDSTAASAGLYVRNVNPLIFSAPVASDAAVFWLDDAGLYHSTMMENWPTVANQLVPCPGAGCSVWLTVIGGWVNAIDELNLP